MPNSLRNSDFRQPEHKSACYKRAFLLDLKMLCPCQSQKEYADCCQPFHEAFRQPKTAEQLMRSRYSAYVLQKINYIIQTTIPKQQSQLNREDLANWSKNTDWRGLTVLRHVPNISPHHAQVEFVAKFSENGQIHEHHELSAFAQIGSKWYFIDQTVKLPTMKSPCFCGSERKFKACCGQFFK